MLVKPVCLYFSIAIQWNLCLAQFFDMQYCNVGNFHVDTGNSQSRVRISNRTMKSREKLISCLSWINAS